MSCPLCQGEPVRSSWLGSVTFRGKEFPYVECLVCRSLYCRPMPDGEDLVAMYGPSYGAETPAPFVEAPKEPERVLAWLERSEPGTFLDYGCGSGELLEAAAARKWQPIGVELDAAVVESLRERTTARILAPKDLLGVEAVADVLHLGDVVEHLTDLDAQMPRILGLLRPGGILLAQGPLEAHANLFTWMVRFQRVLNGRKPLEAAPYHVLLATAAGQSRLFERHDLTEIEFTIHETAWPAPARWSRKLLRNRRALALFVLRRISQALSAILPFSMGNRYFYAGRCRPPRAVLH